MNISFHATHPQLSSHGGVGLGRATHLQTRVLSCPVYSPCSSGFLRRSVSFLFPSSLSSASFQSFSGWDPKIGRSFSTGGVSNRTWFNKNKSELKRILQDAYSVLEEGDDPLTKGLLKIKEIYKFEEEIETGVNQNREKIATLSFTVDMETYVIKHLVRTKKKSKNFPFENKGIFSAKIGPSYEPPITHVQF